MEEDLISKSMKRQFKIIFWISLIIGIYTAIDSYLENQEENRRAYEYREQQIERESRRKKQKRFELTDEQKQRQKDALETPFESSEPLPSEVDPDDEEKYNWIMDHPDYNGDYEYFEDQYESDQGF
ncbi:MAG: hypothetical protein DSY76_09345 [Bacteroidetes bacterium]|nr:MAG: hypothetical protein DSY76_09345 [Bacteroidota bacterium]